MAASKTGGHDVMISYQHDYQPLMLKVAESLERAGYKVWMDMHDLKGSLVSGMAEAVEGADIVLIAMSRSYQESFYCKKEVEFALNSRKKMIPLLVEKEYKPANWLGFTIGGDLYYDVTDTKTFDQTMTQLIKDIGSHVKRSVTIKKSVKGAVSHVKNPEFVLYAARDDFKKGVPPEKSCTSEEWAEKAKNIGTRGWSKFDFLLFGPGNELYAVKDGQFYRGDEPGGKKVAWTGTTTRIGKAGWDLFKFLFFDHAGDLYAVHKEGQFYKGPPPRRDDEDWLRKATMIGKSSWDKFQFLFFHPSESLLYGVFNGKFYKGPPPKDSHTDWISKATLIGAKSWDNFQHLFFDPSGLLYATTNDGKLLAGSPPNGGNWSAIATVKGTIGWNEFNFLFFPQMVDVAGKHSV